MFNVSDEVYQIDPKALKSGVLISRWTEIVTASGAALTVEAITSATPGDRIRVLTEIAAIITGGAAQTSSQLEHEIMGPQLNRLYSRQQRYTAVNILATSLAVLNWILLPGETIGCNGLFSAAVAVNTVELRVIGYELPRGNVM